MAELFQGKGRALSTSNSGAELLLLSLSAVIENPAPATLDALAVKHFIQICRDQSDGWRSFRIHPIPEPLAMEGSQRFFASKIAELVTLLIASSPPRELRNRLLDRNDQIRWAAFSYELHRLLEESGWAVDALTEPQFFSGGDAKQFLLHRLYIQRTDLQRRRDLPAEAELLERIISLENEVSAASWTLFFDRAEVLAKLSRISEAVTVLREGAESVDATEAKASLLEYASQLESAQSPE